MVSSDKRDTGDAATGASQSGNRNRAGELRPTADNRTPREALMAMLPDNATRQKLAAEMRDMPDDDPLWSLGHAIALVAKDGRNKSIDNVEKRVKTAARDAIDQHVWTRAIHSWATITGIIAAAFGAGAIIGAAIGAALVMQ